MGLTEVNEQGQMTVEFVVAFPVMLIVAIIAINVLLLFSQCAQFDNLFRESVRLHATSPAYGQSLEQGCSEISADLELAFDKNYVETSVGVESVAYGFRRYTGTLSFKPTLFGRPLVVQVFGVSIPPCTHRVCFVVDPYKPGVIA